MIINESIDGVKRNPITGERIRYQCITLNPIRIFKLKQLLNILYLWRSFIIIEGIPSNCLRYAIYN